jgi:hypothetical protein
MTYRWGKGPDLEFDWKLSLTVFAALAITTVAVVAVVRQLL